MTAPAIRLRHVTHRFGTLPAVEDLSIDVPPGEIFGFIGPNGAGKTTTLRIMATLLEPTEGRVEIAGVDAVVDPQEVRRLVGYMPDHSGVYERITVREYLEFFARAAGVQGTSPVEAAIELTGLGDWQPRLVATLSKGMRQRLGLARVLLHDPRVLVLDEPASDLDPRARIEMRDLLFELKDLGKTIFLSSHILSELDDVCTQVGILDRGRLLVAGPIGEIDAALGARAARAASSAGQSRVDGASPVVDATAPAALEDATAAATGRRRLKIRVLGEAGDWLVVTRADPGVITATAGAGGFLSVEHRGDERFIAGLVRSLVQAGAAVVAVEPERAELERIFMEVTTGRSS